MRMIGIDAMASNPYGDLYGGLFKAAAGIVEGVNQGVRSEQAQNEAAGAANAQTAAAISADAIATAALARALQSADYIKSNPKSSPQAKKDQAAADAASRAQDKAGAAPQVNAEKRIAAAQKALESASGTYLQAAWKRTLSKAQGITEEKNAASAAKVDAETGLLSKPLIGPVKVWHAALAGLLAAGAAAWRLK